MIQYFEKAIDRVGKEEYRAGRIDRVTPSFKLGAAIRVGSKLCERKKEILRDGFNTATCNISALVVKNQSDKEFTAIEAFINQAYADKQIKQKMTKYTHNTAMHSGFSAADRIGIDSQINPSQSKQLSSSAK
jgi:hypothetical protein